jgi:hypothetical protein
MSKIFNTRHFKLISRMGLILVLAALLAVSFPQVRAQAYTGYPTFSIVSVVADESVTIQAYNLPADQIFTVRMGEIGTKAIGGVIVATTDSGVGGSVKLTYTIPASLKGLALIAIRMDSPLGYYAYNWFYNNSTGVVAPTPATPVYTGIPTFSIKAVVQDESVTILTNNFPADETFTVRMGAYGTKGINGIVIGTTESGTGGAFEATYTIPEALKGSYRIAIRMDSPNGYYAYNWFYNNSTAETEVTPEPEITPTVPVYTGIPTFSIKAVVEDGTVTILTNNFPVDETFTVRMGLYGTKAIGGIVVATTESGVGGVFEATYTIPDDLKGLYRIAIRMDSPNGFYAYNWFYNNTTP